MKEYNIKREAIHKELRLFGSAARRLLPYLDEPLFHLGDRVQRLFGLRGPGVEQVYVERPDKTRLRLCVYSGNKKSPTGAGMLWLHGGGYAMGTPEAEGGIIRRIMRACGCVCVAPDYRLSLDAPYPAALMDSFLALEWLMDNAEAYGVDKNRVMVGGDSAGGGLTAALCIYARDHGVKVAFQFPLYPMLDDRPTATSMDNDAPVWNERSNVNAWALYLRGQGCEPPAYAAPARLADFSGLPPAFTFVGSIDPFLAETRSYFDRLSAAGVPAECVVFDGCFHAFDELCPWSKPSKEARRLFYERLRQAAGIDF